MKIRETATGLNTEFMNNTMSIPIFWNLVIAAIVTFFCLFVCICLLKLVRGFKMWDIEPVHPLKLPVVC